MADYGEDQFLCFMYYDEYSTDLNDERGAYYLLWGYPTCMFNGYKDVIGGDSSGTTYEAFKEVIDEELARPSTLRMSVNLDITGDTGTITGQIEALDSVPEALVHVVVYEDPGPRQPHVSRSYPVYREHLTAREIGQTQSITGTFTVEGDWVAGDLHAVMFVQNTYAAHDYMVVAGPGPGDDNITNVHAYRHTYWFEYDYGFIRFVDIDAYPVDRFGVNVATGDIDGDDFDEIITGAGPGAVFGPHVRGFEYNGDQLPGVSYLAYGTNKYGVNVTTGDIDGDDFDEIITGAGPGAVFGPHVRAWDYDDTGTVTAFPSVSYFAYGTPKWGVNVAAGDIDGDGYDEIVTGAGPGSVYGPHVRGWNYDDDAIASISNVSFLAYGTNKWGVHVACGDIDGDGMDEIITGAGPGAVFGPHVRAWNCDGGTATTISGVNFFAFEYGEWGVFVGSGDVDGDGVDEILAGKGPGEEYEPRINVYAFDGSTAEMVDEFTSFSGAGTTHGVKPTAGFFGDEPPE